MNPYLSDADFMLYNGDAVSVLRELPQESVDCCVTSPPFWAQRNYMVDGQIGREATVADWTSVLVAVFAEVRRVLRTTGSLWIECGDSHKAKNVIGQPFRLAFGLQDDGWLWRGWYPWIKRNAMPESVTDRLSVCASMVMQFTKASQYFFDGVAIQEEAAWDYWGKQGLRKLDGRSGARGASMRFNEFGRDEIAQQGTKWPRGWFDIPTVAQSLALCAVCGAFWDREVPGEHCGQPVVAHYAAFPPALPERILLAATSARGRCVECGKPWVRSVERQLGTGAHGIHRPTAARGNALGDGNVRSDKRSRDGFIGGQHYVTTTTGWQPTCDHEGEPEPSIVLDPFLGSGTTALVARRLGRCCVGIELSEPYCQMAAKRLAQQSLLTEIKALTPDAEQR